MRILFMGTPQFAVASLRTLVDAGHDICAVFTQPDKPKNRGHKLAFSPVKEYALTKNIPVFQPLKMNDGEALGMVKQLCPELIVVAAYGRILPEAILNVPKHGAVNVHSSLLPKYRGAAPINWAIIQGEQVTGATIMYMVRELDAGDIIRTVETTIMPDEDAQMLTVRLAELGAQALLQVVNDLENGSVVRTPQEHGKMTYAPMLDKSLSPLDFSKSAQELHNQVRGLLPWPCAEMLLQETLLKVYKTAVGEQTNVAPGKIAAATKKSLSIACGDGKALQILEVQPQGGKRMPISSYLAGHPLRADA